MEFFRTISLCVFTRSAYISQSVPFDLGAARHIAIGMKRRNYFLQPRLDYLCWNETLVVSSSFKVLVRLRLQHSTKMCSNQNRRYSGHLGISYGFFKTLQYYRLPSSMHGRELFCPRDQFGFATTLTQGHFFNIALDKVKYHCKHHVIAYNVNSTSSLTFCKASPGLYQTCQLLCTLG